MKKKIASIVLLATMACLVMGATKTNYQTARVAVNNQSIDCDAVIVNDRVLVPLRGVFEKIGFDVAWDDSERKATFTYLDSAMEIWADKPEITVDNNKIVPDVPAQIIDGRLYLPLRVVGEAFGMDVEWDSECKCAYIDYDIQQTVIDPIVETVKANPDFAYKLNQLMPRDKNYMFSPISIKMALALAANGANGETQQQILSAIGADDIDSFNAYAKQLIADSNSNENVQLKIANSLWLNTDRVPNVTFNNVYKKNMKNIYSAATEEINNKNAVAKINNWCDENTNGKIKQIIDNPDFLACLANAIYFKGTWAEQFEESATYAETFTDRNGNKKEIDFMHMTDSFAYYSDSDVKMVKMPYKGGTTAMYVVLGDKKKPVKDLTAAMDKMQYKEVAISMPKFKIEYSTVLNDDLKQMGITTAFDDSKADFFSMFDNYSEDSLFYINKVLHKTYIDVDENGTEAAAVTAILMECTAAYMEEPEIIEFKADKPFTFIITDTKTDEILFMGEYAF